ncbi:uncharacterized protein LOC113331036 isoform X1 [Papaver somniferum]|uniref:uncharacterized protein LOC113331036 isoform X1 n=1 Tax=Papaver somniferum TaxID=3469 RepID=UPI000E702A5C|nr:uncharacterized protein LOC113331036 isoform X1 [Papaver somniferum]
MASRLSNALNLFIFISLLCLRIRAEEGNTGSVFFIDSTSQGFLRSSDLTSQGGSMLLSDVTAALLILLGFAPPASLTAESSIKLNGILSPNPFGRPHAVLMLEVSGTRGWIIDLYNGSYNFQRIYCNFFVLADQIPAGVKFGSYIQSTVVLDSVKADVQLPERDEVSMISVGESEGSECNAACMEKELHDMAAEFGGSYVDDELTIDLASGTRLNLHMAKKADREFTIKLVSLVRDIRGAVEIHRDLDGRMKNQAELIKGRFVGIKALQEQYGPDGVAQQGMELFQMMLEMIFDPLQGAYQGQIVGVILFTGVSLPESEAFLNVKSTSRTSRLLEEKAPTASPTHTVEILLVRRTLAWITGIILLISTLLGMFFLFNMPITRDTLLYSNVKLD